MIKSQLLKQSTNENFYFSKGNKVWVENINSKHLDDEKEEPYDLATVIRNDENRKEIEVAFISISRGNEIVKYDRIIQYINPSTLNVNDMAAIEDINEVDLLSNLKNRFYNKLIFTNVGSTLIVVNPYQTIQGVFGEEKMEKLQQIHQTSISEDRKEFDEPHLYNVTMIAIKNLLELKKNQAIVISGESGAGKTETAKNAMNFITYYFKKNNRNASNPKLISDQKSSENNLLEHRILGCNPILEAFGNAKTIRNDNSSRFGKYVTIHIDVDQLKIEGAQIETYLLEKSRVCEPAEFERNYHIFYHLLLGAPDNLLRELFLTRQPNNYYFLSRTKCFRVDSIDDAGLFQDVMKAFSVTGFSNEEILTINKIIAACLLLGNVSFKEEGGDIFVVDHIQFEHICKLLGCTNEMLDKALTQNVRIVQNEVITSPLKLTECLSYRNILAKELYNRVFNWIVKKLNKTLSPGFNTSPGKKEIYIGLLDIFGFECFKNNSLEQLFINYTNEKLQQLYIKDIFKGETQEFIKEGISEKNIKINFKDNQHVIDLLDKSGGLLQLLDDVTLTNQNDAVYYSNIKRIHSVNPTCKIKLSPKFSIFHTAKDVEYNAEGFIEKNMDEVKSTMTDLALNSTNIIIRYIFLNSLDEDEYKTKLQYIELEKSNKTVKKELKFLCSKFRNEMNLLMEELSSCQCNYIRCLKPNEIKIKEFFVPTFVFKQIRYLGILDTIKVRKEGYPIRQKFKDFFLRLKEVCWYKEKSNLKEKTKKIQDDQSYKDLAVQCLNYVPISRKDDECLIGKTKIFMKHKFFANIETFRICNMKLIDSAALVIGKIYRGFKLRKEIEKKKKNIELIQLIFRKRRYAIVIYKMRESSKIIQRAYRACVCLRAEKYKFICYYKIQNYIIGYLVKKKIKKKLSAGKFITRCLKMIFVKIRYANIRHIKHIVHNLINLSLEYFTNKYEFFSALMIQSNIRKFIVRKNHSDKILRGQLKRIQFLKKKFAIIIQKNYRGHMSRNMLIKAFHAATLLQGFWMMTRYMSLISHMRSAVKIIKKNVIAFLTRKKIINSRCHEFFKDEKKILDKLMLDTSIILFPNYVKINEINMKGVGSYSYSNIIDTFSDSLYSNEKIKDTLTPIYDPYGDDKISLFAKIIDLDIIVDSNEDYNRSWTKEFEKIYKKNLINKTPIQIIHIGSSHSMTINSKGRIYSWGWNNHGQCGHSIFSTFETVMIPNFNREKNIEFPILPVLNYLKPGKPIIIPEMSNIKHVVCGEDLSFIVDDSGNAFSFGDNTKGKLGLGHTNEVNKPTIITELQGKVKEIKTSGEINMAITHDNCIYIWPVDFFKQNYKPVRLFLEKKIVILTVSCGKNFAFLLTKQGVVYSYGKSNKSGELGLGDYKPRIIPEPILSLAGAGEKITQLSCGYKHCLAKNSLGKVFTWGNNSYGQLGLGHFQNAPIPNLISFDNLYPNRTKIIQVSAGFRSSFFLTESRNINYCGTNGDLNKVNLPVKMELSIKNLEVADDNSFSVVRILNTWNNSFSVFYCTFADLRMTQEKIKNKHKINNILNTLASKWDTDSVCPPYIDSIAGYFTPYLMKKPKEEKKKKI